MQTRSWFGDCTKDVRHAFRQMLRRPGFALAFVGVLGLGMGLAAAVFAVVDAALLRPLPFPDAQELVVVRDVQGEDAVPASWPEFVDWRRDGAFFEGLAAYTRATARLVTDRPEEVRVGWVGGDFMTVTGLDAVAGRGFTTAEIERAEAVVMIDEDRWRAAGADPAVVGSTVTLSGTARTVVGVMPREAGLLVGQHELAFWQPVAEQEWMSRGLHFLTVVGRLDEGVDLADAAARADALAAGLVEAGVTDHGIRVTAARDHLLGPSQRVVHILAGAVALVVLAVAATLANLWLVRTLSRRRELAVRASLGAGRGRLARQVATEAAVLGTVAGVLAILVARWVVGVVVRATGSDGIGEIASAGHPRVVLFALGMSALAGAFFGWLPVRGLGAGAPALALREGGGSGRSGRRARRAMVAVEVGLSVVLLASAGLLVRSATLLLDQDPGFRAEGVLTADITLPGDRFPDARARSAFWETVVERGRALPGVEETGLIHNLPFRGNVNGGFTVVGAAEDPEDTPSSVKQVASPGYFEAMGIPVLRGRAFTDSDRMDAPQVAVVSESIARRYFPGGDAVGRRIRFGWMTGQDQEIVGVVADVRTSSLDEEGVGTIYMPAAQLGPASLHLVVRAEGDPLALAGPVRALVQDIDSQQPVGEIVSIEALVRSSVAGLSTLGRLLVVFAAVALLLAVVGLYGVAAQGVLARRREIAVRMAVGADRPGVVAMVVREELVPVTLGAALGIAAVIPAGRALSELLYRTSPGEPVVIGGAVCLLVLTALAAILVPASRASRIRPAAVLRGD